MIGSMEVPRDDTIRRRKQDEIEVKEAEKQKRKNSQGREMSPPCILSLDDEFKQLVGGGEEDEEEEERVVNEETLLEDLIEEGSEADRSSKSEESTTEGEKEGGEYIVIGSLTIDIVKYLFMAITRNSFAVNL